MPRVVWQPAASTSRPRRRSRSPAWKRRAHEASLTTDDGRPRSSTATGRGWSEETPELFSCRIARASPVENRVGMRGNVPELERPPHEIGPDSPHPSGARGSPSRSARVAKERRAVESIASAFLPSSLYRARSLRRCPRASKAERPSISQKPRSVTRSTQTVELAEAVRGRSRVRCGRAARSHRPRRFTAADLVTSTPRRH